MSRTRSTTIGPASRPVAIPDDIDDPRRSRATGRVELPFHVRWNGPPIAYDLDDPRDRRRVYEQVLREGTEDDVRFFIDVHQLIALWDDLVLPPHVRNAWASWLQTRL